MAWQSLFVLSFSWMDDKSTTTDQQSACYRYNYYWWVDEIMWFWVFLHNSRISRSSFSLDLVLHAVSNSIWMCFDDWAPFVGEGRYAQKHTQREEEEEGVVRQQTDTRCFHTFQTASTVAAEAAAVQYFETCLCRQAVVVRGSPAARAPCEENKVWQGALKLHEMWDWRRN